MEIHTTIGLYLDGSHVINGVSSNNLYSHVGYNVINRQGRALFVDGACAFKGSLSNEAIAAFCTKIKENPTKFKATKDTAPYL